MSFIEWFIRLVRRDMENYEEDRKIKKDIYIALKQKNQKKDNR